MAETNYVEVGALNIVASPHPEGIYLELVKAISGKELPYVGSDWIKLTAPEEFEAPRGFYHGQILIWTEIDTNKKWLNKEKDAEATDEEMRKVEEALLPNFEPNFRPFTYILDPAEHIVLIETKNEFGQNFSARRAGRAFANLIETLSAEWPEVSVTVIPEDETLEKIFAIPHLRKLEIVVERPNADDLGDDFNRIMTEMQAEGAKSWRIEKIRAAKQKTLKPSDETKRIAAVAATNGHVSGEGTDESGSPVFESTEEHPKIRRIKLITSTFSAIFSALHLFRKPVEKPGSSS